MSTSGGRARYLEYLAHAVSDGNSLAIHWWRVFEQLRPHEQTIIAFEDVCVASGVLSSDLVGLIVATAMKHGADVADIAASMELPSVVHQLAKSAKRIGVSTRPSRSGTGPCSFRAGSSRRSPRAPP